LKTYKQKGLRAGRHDKKQHDREKDGLQIGNRLRSFDKKVNLHRRTVLQFGRKSLWGKKDFIQEKRDGIAWEECCRGGIEPVD